MIEVKAPHFSEQKLEQIHKRLLQEVFEETRQRGEIWLYERGRHEDSIQIGIWGLSGGTFLFEAVPKRFLDLNDTEEADQMVLNSNKPKLSEVKRKLKGFLKRQYQKLDGLPVLLVTNAQDLRTGKWREREIKFQVIRNRT